MDLPSWVSSLPSSFASFAGAHRALDSVTKMEADGGPSYRLGNCDPAITPDRQCRILQIFLPNKRSWDLTKTSAQLDTKRRLLPHKPHTILLNHPSVPNRFAPPRRRLVVTVTAESRPTQNHLEVARRSVLIRERRSRWSIQIFNILLVSRLPAASPRRAMMVLPRLGSAMAGLRHRQHWILFMVTRLMVVQIVSISFTINLASGPCVRCM